MRTIRAIVHDGNLKPLDPIELPENTHMTVALIETDDLSSEAIPELARKDPAFQFLSDPREDIYTEFDGEAL